MFKSLSTCPYNPTNEAGVNFNKTCFEAAANQIKTWGSEYSTIADKLVRQ